MLRLKRTEWSTHMLSRLAPIAAGHEVHLATFTRVVEADVPELVPVVKHMITNRNVDEEREENAHPNGNVV